MIRERFVFSLIGWLFGSRKVTEITAFSIASALMVLAATVLVEGALWVTLAYLPFFLFVERMGASPKFVAFCTVKNGYIAIGLAVLLMLGGFAIAYYGNVSQAEFVESYSAYAFLTIGFLLGILLRRYIRIMSLAVLFGRRRLLIKIVMCGLWTVAIVVFPRGVPLESALYLIGGGLGVFVSKGVALALSRTASGFRRLEGIYFAWRDTDVDARRSEMEALQLLSDGRDFPSLRFKRLRKSLEKVRHSKGVEFTKFLALISASVYRLEGNYTEAIREVELAETGGDDVMEVHLLIMKILSLEEMGEEQTASQELERLACLSSSADCPVTATLIARRKAEQQLALWAEEPRHILETEPSLDCLEKIWVAMDLQREIMGGRFGGMSKKERVKRFLAGFSEVGVPVTPSWMTDTIGLCHLAAGYGNPASLYFKRCIGTDPVYSQAYLHLGDFYMFRNSILHPEASPKKTDIWHARICFLAAQMIEVNEGSRVKRLSVKRLELLQKFAQSNED